MTDKQHLIDILTQTGYMEEAEEYAELKRVDERANTINEVLELLVELQVFCEMSAGLVSGETIIYKLNAKLEEMKGKQ
jgi:hypothetical protein